MLNTRERQESKVKYNRSYENSYDCDAQDNSRYSASRPYTSPANVYPESRRATTDDRYQSTYSSQDKYGYNSKMESYNDTYPTMDDTFNSCASNSQVFSPIEVTDLDMAPAQKTKRFTRGKSKMSTRAKVLAVVYASLMTLIIVMLLVNAIPSVGAQTPTVITPDNVVNETVRDNSFTDAVNSGNIPVVAEYKFDTETNWFDNFCDFFEGLFS